MGGPKIKWLFRERKTVAPQSTLDSPTNQPHTALAAPNRESSSNGIALSTVPVREDSHENHESLPIPGQDDIWGLAYNQLLAENEPLVRHYEEVLKTAGSVPDDSVADIQEQIQAVLVLKRKQVLQKQWRLQWGNRSIKVRIQIDRIVRIISAFKEAGSVAVNVDPLHAGLPWAGICFLLAPILNDSQQGEALLSGLEMITDLVARHRIVDEQLSQGSPSSGSHLASEAECQRILTRLYTKVLEFQAKAACYLSHGTLTRFTRNIPKVDDWRSLQSSIVQIEAEFREYTSLRLAMKQQSSLRVLIESLDEQQDRLADRITHLNIQQDAAQMVTRLISDISVGQDHEDIRTRLGSQYWDSGQWLFKSRQYLDWTTCDISSILWLQGPVGVGKSCMMSVVVQHFLANAIDNKVAFFYCSQNHSNSADVLRSLLAQVSYGTDGDLVRPVREWFELQTGVSFRTNKKLHTSVLPYLARKISSKECVELLWEIIPCTKQTTFIIDALDECHDHGELLDHLKRMLVRFAGIKIFVSSRMGIYPQYKFIGRYVIEHFDSSSDIIHFIDYEIDSSARRGQSGMTPAQAELLRDLLVSRANKMFRWVELQLDVFLSRTNPILHPSDVQIKLDQLKIQSAHPSLTPVYMDLFLANTLDQPYRRGLAIKTLQWVFCAVKPLIVQDLVRAVAVQSDGTADSVVTERFLLQVCGSFIIVTNSGVVRFAHRSVEEFLTHRPLPGSRWVEIPLWNAHAQVAETCLSFLLSLEDASKWANLPPVFHEASGLNLTGFEVYACFFWAFHYENAMTNGNWELSGHLLKQFVCVSIETVTTGEVAVASTAFQRWISLLWRILQKSSTLEDPMRQRLEDAISDPPLPLFAACIWGFTDDVKLMVQGTRANNPTNSRGKSCFYLACENGHRDIVEFLPQAPAIARYYHEKWGSNLHAAALSGQLEIFVSVLKSGAQVNTPEGCYGRTIDAAIRGGNPAIVTKALREGAEVWLPSTDAPIRPRKIRSNNIYSMEITSSGTSSEDTSAFSDSEPDLLVAPIRVGSFGIKRDRPPEHYDLRERLRKASLIRRKLLNHWRVEHNKPAVDNGASDKAVIFNETYATSRFRTQRNCLSLEDNTASHTRCYYCFQFTHRTNSALLRRNHLMQDLLPYLCPLADCNLKNKMWGARSDWETHLNEQHSILNVQFERYSFTCNICCRTYGKSDTSGCISPASHYAEHMERIASSVVKDYGPDSSAGSRKRISKKHPKRRRRHGYRSGSSSERDEEAMSGWSSEGSTGSQG